MSHSRKVFRPQLAGYWPLASPGYSSVLSWREGDGDPEERLMVDELQDCWSGLSIQVRSGSMDFAAFSV